MLLTMQIAIGIWAGGLFLFGTAAVCFRINDRIKRNQRFGAPWWRDLHRAA